MTSAAPAGERIARLFRALSDPTRLRILALLRRGELCVGDLVSILGAPQAKTSRHLAYLRAAGLVRARDEGPWAFYSLAPAGGRLHGKILECIDEAARSLPACGEDLRRAAPARKGGGCCPR
jgi:ArsR family transcriptional regulator